MYARPPQQQQYRRPGVPHHAPPQPPPQQRQQQQQMTAQQAEQYRQEQIRRVDLARRQSRKPTDREIPEELADVIVGDGVDRYKKLRDVERRLDAVMMRKRMDINDNVNRQYTRHDGLLRIWISNTAEGQPWQVAEDGGVGFAEDGTFDFGENSQATFRVKIEGRLLPESMSEDDNMEEEKEEEKVSSRPRLSHFFKSITIRFDRNPALQPDGYSAIEWQKPDPKTTPNVDPSSSEVNFDTLEFERKSDENINVTVELVRDVKMERYKLSAMLAEIIDSDEEDIPGAARGIWEYCRAMGLQEDDDRRNVVCDEPLRRLFQKESIYFPEIPLLLRPHLKPLEPIKLSYTIRVDKQYITGTEDSSPCAPTIYDVLVPLPNPIPAELANTTSKDKHRAALTTIISTDDDLALLVQKIHNTNAKRKFLENLSKDPANFVKRWFESQMRDQEVILAEGARGGGAGGGGGGGYEEGGPGGFAWRGGEGGLWGSEGARESVGLWLARNTKAH